MLDPALLRHQPADLAERLRTSRGFELDVSALEALEADRKRIQVRTQELQSLRNSRSKAIGQAKAKGEDVSAIMAEVAAFADELKASEVALDELREKIEAISMGIPNLPADDAGRCRRERQRRAGALGYPAPVRFQGARPRRTAPATAGRNSRTTCSRPPWVTPRGTDPDLGSACDQHRARRDRGRRAPAAAHDRALDVLPRRGRQRWPRVRGMIRQHQFEKVELVSISRPEARRRTPAHDPLRRGGAGKAGPAVPQGAAVHR